MSTNTDDVGIYTNLILRAGIIGYTYTEYTFSVEFADYCGNAILTDDSSALATTTPSIYEFTGDTVTHLMTGFTHDRDYVPCPITYQCVSTISGSEAACAFQDALTKLDYATHNGELTFWSTDVYGIGPKTVTFTIDIFIASVRVAEKTYTMNLVNPCSSVMIDISREIMLGTAAAIEYEIYDANSPFDLIFDPNLVLLTPNLPICPLA